MDLNAAVGGKKGLSCEKIEVALGVGPAESANVSLREHLALAYADRVSATPVDVSDDFYARRLRARDRRADRDRRPRELQLEVQPTAANRGERLLRAPFADA